MRRKSAAALLARPYDRSEAELSAAAALVCQSVGLEALTRLGTESLLTLRWRELDSKFQFLDLGRAFFTRSGAFNPHLQRQRRLTLSNDLAHDQNPAAAVGTGIASSATVRVLQKGARARR